jgi:hypothetical protein
MARMGQNQRSFQSFLYVSLRYGANLSMYMYGDFDLHRERFEGVFGRAYMLWIGIVRYPKTR